MQPGVSAVRTLIGVMGSGHQLSEAQRSLAYRVGALVASKGWVLLTGGSACGVMDAASQGAHEAGGLVVGVLREASSDRASSFVDVAIPTGMGDARNAINVLSSDVVIALPGGSGTLSEIALALKSGKTTIALGWDPGPALRSAGPGRLLNADTAEAAIDLVERALAEAS